ncbi:hypothetical protein Hdeb2414_s0009g00313891 [Helianthus debilis subsp. tardiflorus]
MYTQKKKKNTITLLTSKPSHLQAQLNTHISLTKPNTHATHRQPPPPPPSAKRTTTTVRWW